MVAAAPLNHQYVTQLLDTTPQAIPSPVWLLYPPSVQAHLPSVTQFVATIPPYPLTGAWWF